jgi:triosephosphate isomerase
MIIVNFKNYKTGVKVLSLAKKIHGKIIVAVPRLNIKEILEKTKLKVYAQHVDYQNYEKTTGFTTPKGLKESGVEGSLLNHSEHKIKLQEIKKTIKESKKVNLKLIVCVSNLKEANQIKKLKPFAIAFEDPKLVSTKKSITKYKANDLKKFVSLLKNTKIIALCGAGINSKEDYTEALKLGCKGVLISSAVANSKKPETFLKKLTNVIG